MSDEKKLTKEELMKIILEIPDGEIHIIPFEDGEKDGDGHEV